MKGRVEVTEHHHKPSRNGTFRPKPLSAAMQAGLELVLVGHTDQDVANAVGVARETVWSWRRTHPLFMTALEVRRAEIYGTTCERLRALMSKAVDNIEAAIAEGNLGASWELMRCIGLNGNGGMNAIHEQILSGSSPSKRHPWSRGSRSLASWMIC